MTQMVLHFEECDTRLGPVPWGNTALAQTIGDQDQDIEAADAFVRLAEIRVPRSTR